MKIVCALRLSVADSQAKCWRCTQPVPRYVSRLLNVLAGGVGGGSDRARVLRSLTYLTSNYSLAFSWHNARLKIYSALENQASVH
jgi:hypothetical protein